MDSNQDDSLQSDQECVRELFVGGVRNNPSDRNEKKKEESKHNKDTSEESKSVTVGGVFE